MMSIMNDPFKVNTVNVLKKKTKFKITLIFLYEIIVLKQDLRQVFGHAVFNQYVL